MSALPRVVPAPAPARVALLGTGQVGTAWLARLQEQGAAPELVATANTRRVSGRAAADNDLSARGQDHAEAAVRALGRGGTRILVDATASDAVAARHARWLEAGVHVVTACKLGQGTTLARWREIATACTVAGTRYGDSATVGAGLPLLRNLRELQRSGERIHAIAGVLSGSLAWLCAQHDGRRPFHELLQEAAMRGYTEPDPAEDLSGEDVRRKLLILARAAGHALEHDAVAVEPLPVDAMDARLASARACGCQLAYVARVQRDGQGRLAARAGLEALPPGDPLAAGRGCDNRVAIWCDRYPEQPLRIHGPGAGAAVTAAALMDDVLRITRSAALSPGRPGNP